MSDRTIASKVNTVDDKIATAKNKEPKLELSL